MDAPKFKVGDRVVIRKRWGDLIETMVEKWTGSTEYRQRYVTYENDIIDIDIY